MNLAQTELPIQESALPPTSPIKTSKKPKESLLNFFLHTFFDTENFCSLRPDIDLSLITEFVINDQSLEKLGKIHPSMTSLNLSGCSKVTDDGLILLSKLCRKLTCINLSRLPQISSLGFRAIGLSNKFLEISLFLSEHVDDDYIRAISSTSFLLKRFSLTQNKLVTDNSLITLSQCCHDLEELNLSDCEKVSQFGNYFLSSLAQTCTKLITVKISGCAFVKNPGVISLVRNCLFLENLLLNFCTLISDFFINTLAQDDCFYVMKGLSLGNNRNITQKSLGQLCHCFPDLVELSLQKNDKLTDAAVRELVNSRQLKSLNLGSCKHLSNRALETIAANLTLLQTLNLSENNTITETGVQSLFTGCTSLIRLELVNCDLLPREILEETVANLPFVELANDRCAFVPLKGDPKYATYLIHEFEKSVREMNAACVIQKFMRRVKEIGGARERKRLKTMMWLIVRLQPLYRKAIASKRLRLETCRKQCNSAAVIIKRIWKHYLWIVSLHRKFKNRKNVLIQEKNVVTIQNVFRGYVARCTLSLLQNEKKEKLAAKAREEEKLKLGAIKVTSFAHLVLAKRARISLVETREKITALKKLQNVKALSIQLMFRVNSAKLICNRARRKKERQMLELRSCIRIQNALRRKETYKLFAKLKNQAILERRNQAAVLIQKIWRGYCGKQVAAVFRGFKKLSDLEQGFARKIQGCYRCYRAYCIRVDLEYKRNYEQFKQSAACLIQKVYRKFFLKKEFKQSFKLKKLNDKLQISIKKLDELIQKLNKLAREQRNEQKTLSTIESNMMSMILELERVCKSSMPYYDSKSVTGTTQRYETRHLARMLRLNVEQMGLEKQKRKQNVSILAKKRKQVEIKIEKQRAEIIIRREKVEVLRNPPVKT
eukprot:snap_masked-scaffold_4-processed-gene-17.31-mRNA-1 protein AED:1.00 eAED:1.00 QI:0/-1/0/0/-1/1/1/0/887